MKILDKFKKKIQNNPNVQQSKNEKEQVYSSLAQYSQQLEEETQRNLDAIYDVHQKIKQMENSPAQQRMDRLAREAIESLAKDMLGNNKYYSKNDEYAKQINEITRFIDSVYDKVEDYGKYYLNTDSKNEYNIAERRKQLFANSGHELLSRLMIHICINERLSSYIKLPINDYSNGKYEYVLLQYKYNILKSKIDLPIEILFIYHILYADSKKVRYATDDLSTKTKKIMDIYAKAMVSKQKIASDLFLQSLALNVILGTVSMDYLKSILPPSNIEEIQDAIKSYNITLPNELPEELMQYVVEENLDDTRGPRR